MMCPFCLNQVSGPKCPKCDHEIPPLYQKNSRRLAIFSAVGFSGHGKSVYLAALLHALNKQLVHPWPKFIRQALNIETVLKVQSNLAELYRGVLPESTRRNFPLPSVHLLTGIPQIGATTLLAYDPPGEAFNTDEEMERFAHFVQVSPVVVFLVSLVDLEPPEDEDLFRLLNTYVLGMARMKARTKNQHLVVAYTKADLLVKRLTAYPGVIEHLGNPANSEMAEPRRYINKLKAISSQLAGFTEQDFGAVTFMRLAKNEFKSVNFCVVSALGSPPEHGHLSTAIAPRRVADPLMWVLEKS